MDPTQKSGLTRKPLKKGKRWIKQQSPRSIKYQDFRNLKAVKDRDEEGLLHCQDYLIGLPRCGVALPSLDLHHSKGRNGDLLFDERYLVWLVRTCHEAAHNTSSPSTEAENDPQRPLEATPQRDAILGVQGRSAQSDNGDTGPEIYGSVQSMHANVVERKEEGVV